MQHWEVRLISEEIILCRVTWIMAKMSLVFLSRVQCCFCCHGYKFCSECSSLHIVFFPSPCVLINNNQLFYEVVSLFFLMCLWNLRQITLNLLEVFCYSGGPEYTSTVLQVEYIPEWYIVEYESCLCPVLLDPSAVGFQWVFDWISVGLLQKSHRILTLVCRFPVGLAGVL